MKKYKKQPDFISYQTVLTKVRKQRKRAYFVAKRNRIVGFFAQKFIRFDIGSGTTFIASPTLHKKDEKEIIYNLNGQQVDKTSAQGGIFISRQKGKFYKAPGSSGGRR
ncbi:hypothetical protein [Segatella sp.]|uniref:hypothetical protein n=1 Tax=Segatella sp. TaxID=2974253 RepID=UPI0030784F31